MTTTGKNRIMIYAARRLAASAALAAFGFGQLAPGVALGDPGGVPSQPQLYDECFEVGGDGVVLDGLGVGLASSVSNGVSKGGHPVGHHPNGRAPRLLRRP